MSNNSCRCELKKPVAIKPKKLDALTSLRFFAAAHIVLHHSIQNFKFGTNILGFLPTFQAVSFFFVLSGFILAYVYRDLDSRGSVRRFFLARFARIWPLHCATLLLTLVFLSKWYLPLATGSNALKLFWLPLFSNLCLVQSWIPSSKYYFSFNAVSWSISVELGFYLLFPLLLSGTRRNWPLMWLTTLLCTLGIAFSLNQLSSTTVGAIDSDTITGIIQFNPLARIFEFTSGMVMALLYDKVKNNYNPGIKTATIIELSSLVTVILGVWMGFFLCDAVGFNVGKPGWLWVVVGNANVLFVAPFILLMALAKGMISRILSLSAFVFLGEISFSLYLTHQIILRVYSSSFEDIVATPTWFNFGYFLVIVFLGSYLLWKLVEKPCRWLIVNKNNSGWFFEVKRNLSAMATDKHLLTSTLILIVLLASLTQAPTKPGVSVIAKHEVDSLLTSSNKDFLNIRFGNSFQLNGILFDNAKGPLLKLVWESLVPIQLKYKVAVHFLDSQKKIVSQADFYQSKNRVGKVKAHTFWEDSINLSTIPKNVCFIGLALFLEKEKKLLSISDGPRDWHNQRLIIPLTD